MNQNEGRNILQPSLGTTWCFFGAVEIKKLAFARAINKIYPQAQIECLMFPLPVAVAPSSSIVRGDSMVTGEESSGSSGMYLARQIHLDPTTDPPVIHLRAAIRGWCYAVPSLAAPTSGTRMSLSVVTAHGSQRSGTARTTWQQSGT